jgi:plastocyanin
MRRSRRVAWAAALAMPVLGLVFVFGATPAGAGGSCHSAASASRGVAVTIQDLCFGPTVLYVQPGAAVTWTNRDDFEHTVTGLGFQWGSADNLQQGQSYSHRFAQPGVYPYACILHPGMVAAVVVGDAGSPDSVQGLSGGVPANPGGPNAASRKVPASGPAGSSPWRVVSLIGIGLLVLAAAIIAVQRRQMVLRREGVAS